MFDVQRDYRSARRLDLAGDVARFEAIIDRDPAEALAAFQQAAARFDLGVALGAGEALFRRKLLPPLNKADYASALDAEGRHGESATVWGEVVVSFPDQPHAHYALAESLAAGGRFGEAQRAAQEVLALNPDFIRARNLLRRVKWIPKAGAEPRSWPSLRLFLEGCVAVGAVGAARAKLKALSRDPPPGEPSADDAQRLVESGLTLGYAKPVWTFLEIASRNRAPDDAQRAATIQMSSLRGKTHEAAALAAAMLPPLAHDSGLPEAAVRPRRRLRYHAAEAFAAEGRLGEAIQQLGALVTQDRRDFSSLTALQRCTGDAVLQATGGMVWDAPRPPKIINLLPFYNEVALLEMRLAEMGDWVDHFVIVEATTTFTGAEKPLHFAAARDAYCGDRGDQLISVVLDGLPAFCDTAWARDFYQRDWAVQGLIGRLRPDDIILITDADEIVDRRALDGYWPHLASLRMVTSKHFLNYQSLPGTAHANRRSGAICRGEHLARFGSTYLRTALSAARKRWEAIPSAGWHFTSLGQAEAVAQKLAAYAHQEDGKGEHRDVAAMAQRLQRVRDGQYEPGWTMRPVDKSFPRFVRDNQARLAPLLLSR